MIKQKPSDRPKMKPTSEMGVLNWRAIGVTILAILVVVNFGFRLAGIDSPPALMPVSLIAGVIIIVFLRK